MAEKKKVKKPVIGYGANVKAGKKATNKAIRKVVSGVERTANKTVKPQKGKNEKNASGKPIALNMYKYSGRKNAKETGAKSMLPKSYGRASDKVRAISVAKSKIKSGALTARANISTSDVKRSVQERKDYIAAYNAQVKRNRNKGKKK